MSLGKDSKLDARVGKVEQQLTSVNDKLAQITQALGVATDTEVGGHDDVTHVDSNPDIAAAEKVIINKMAAKPTGGMVVIHGPRGAERIDMFAQRLGMLQDLRESRNVKYGAARKIR